MKNNEHSEKVEMAKQVSKLLPETKENTQKDRLNFMFQKFKKQKRKLK